MPTLRLRPFSGKVPKPSNETDYESWRSHVELLLADVNLPPLHVTRKIIESLLSPAADVVKGLRPDTLPSIYLRVLDSAYSTVQDGEELFAQFLNTLQNQGEKPSSYLQRLLLTLNTVVKRGGVAASDIDKHLLKQFCRGCWDNEMISKLQLEHKKDNPPAFSELLLLLRTEEDRQQAKESLMKQHISSSKQRATLHSQSACSCTHDSSTTSINELKKQMEKLQQQMSTLLAQISPTSKTGKCSSASSFQPPKPQNTRPRPGFCFKCEHTPDFHPVPYGYRAVLQVLEYRHKMNREDHHGVVKLNSATPQIIPAGQTILLEGIAVAHSLQTERAVMVEHPTSFHLPGGLMIQSCLVDFSSQHPVLLPVPVTNETDHDVILPACALLAEISAFQSVSCASQSTPESTSTTLRFVEGYSHIVKPLHELTAGYPPSYKKLKPLVNPAQYLNPKEPFGGRWTVACQEAFETIKEKLTSAPVLAFADPKKPYLLHTDASTTGLGAVLYQEQEGQKRVIAYASRGLSRSESRYPAHKLEFLALKWAVTEKFSDYLYGTSFTVVTDSNPLTYLLTSAKLDATSYRWLSALSTYSFKIIYRAGRQNTDADALSRRPHGNLTSDLLSEKEKERIIRFAEHHLDTPNVITIDQHTVQALSDRHLICSAPDQTPDHTLVHSLSMSADSLPDSFTADEQFASSVVSPLSPADIADKQRADPVLGHVIAQLETGDSPPPSVREHLPELPLLLRTYIGWSSMTTSSLHDQMGHMGIERTLDLVRNRFYWPRMANDVQTKDHSYHPRGNPVERFNRTLLDMLGTLAEQEKSHWKDFVKPLVHAYNCTKNDTTGFTPYELMFGRQPRLPIDLVFGLPMGTSSLNHSEYVQKLKAQLEKSYQLAAENAEKIMLKNKTRFDRKIIASELELGDRVLVRNVRLRGKHKIADKWESDVYVVVKKSANLPVYTVRPEHADKPLRTLHRDLLLPCGYLPATSQVQPTPVKRPVKPSVSQTEPETEVELSDEEILPTHWYNTLTSEPIRFSTTVNFPEPSAEPCPGPMPDSSVSPPESIVPGPPDPEPESLPESLSPEPVASDPEMNLPAEADSPVELVSASESDSETNLPPETPTSDVEQPRKSTRDRRPPDRLQYSHLAVRS
ncbi:hypothetical protein WMY93_027039 [Mugilogobius chulae]|uniref:Gypsy retrotransposon integrase-like protein 1 n=1 Tax=Mugilogobius chulae TaxID=88201 RepID=A0AAW0MV52_9GOBI